MLVAYFRSFVGALKDSNPFVRKDIAITLFCALAISAIAFPYYQVAKLSSADIPEHPLSVLVIAILLTSVLYNLLSIQVEHPKDLGRIKKRFIMTCFINLRSTPYLAINLGIMLLPFFVFGEPYIQGLVDDGVLVEDSLELAVLQVFWDTIAFCLLCTLWFLFPIWFFNSLPYAYDKRALSDDVKRGLRKLAFPTLLMLISINIGVGAFYHSAEYLLSHDNIVTVILSGIALAVAFVGFVYLLVVGLTVTARQSGLDANFSGSFKSETINEDTIGDLVSNSKKPSVSNLIPYTDGGFVYYPFTKWHPGFVLTRSEAVELFGELQSKATFSTRHEFLAISFSIIGLAFFRYVALELVLLGLVIVLVWWPLELMFAVKRFRLKFPHAPACAHPFPSEYMHLRRQMLPSPSLWSLWFMFISFVLFVVLFGAILLRGDFEEGSSVLLGFLVMLFGIGACACFWMLFKRLLSAHVHGRKPMPDGLKPIDPLTGKMPEDPFRKTA